MGDQMWQEDAETDRAIELLRVCGAKTDKDGNVVPTYRYSRNFGRVSEHLLDLVWAPQSETVTISKERDPDGHGTTVTVEIAVRMSDGTAWTQEGVVRSSEHPHSWSALAACRALLSYVHDDGEPMSKAEVIQMLEERRANALKSAQRHRA